MKKLNNKDLYQLLYILKNNGNIKRLIRENITFIDIINNVKMLTNDFFLNNDNGKLSFTETGEKLFEELDREYKSRNKDKWIESEKKSKIEKLDIDFVYLPDQSKIFF